MGEMAIGKAVGAEPIELEILAVVGKSATVRRRIGDKNLTGPCLIRDLYKYDEDLVQELHSAFAKNDLRTLDRAWTRAVPLRE